MFPLCLSLILSIFLYISIYQSINLSNYLFDLFIFPMHLVYILVGLHHREEEDKAVGLGHAVDVGDTRVVLQHKCRCAVPVIEKTDMNFVLDGH